jgi:gliding motility-associated-like protein
LLQKGYIYTGLFALLCTIATRQLCASSFPAVFIENKGQTDARARFYTDTRNVQLYAEADGVRYVVFDRKAMDEALKHPRKWTDDLKSRTIKSHAVKMRFAGSSAASAITADMPARHHLNFFTGNNPQNWSAECRVYGRIHYSRVYPQTDARFYATPTGNVKYDLILRPGANPDVIQLVYDGAENIQIKSGALHIKTSVTTWIEEKPYAYQMIENKKVEVPCRYKLNKDKSVSFTLGEYNAGYELIIDPVVVFSTYSGSTVDNFGATATYDLNGNFYSGGITRGPLSGYPATPGAFDVTFNGGQGSWPQFGFSCDITLSKYSNDGSALLYATYLGGDKNEYVHSLVVNARGELIVYGSTLSRNYPVTPLAFDTSHNDTFDIVVTRFSANGSFLKGSTFVGGTGIDGISTPDTLCMNYMDNMRGEVQVTTEGDIVVGSVTRSANFPVSSGAFQPLLAGAQDGCILKLDSSLQIMRWSSFLGRPLNETLNGVEIAADGSIYLTGGTHSTTFAAKGNVIDSNYNGGISDAWLARISKNGDTLRQFMYWGSGAYDQGYFVRTDRNGHVYLIGQTFDSVATTPGTYANDTGTLFISSFTATFDSLRFSTCLGNGVPRNVLVPSAFMVDVCGSIYASVWAGDINTSATYKNGAWILGAPSSTTNLPVTANALQNTTDGEDFYLFVLGSRADTLLYASYLGEITGEDHVDGGTSRFDSRGIIYQSVCASCGQGPGGTFPTTLGSYAPVNRSPRCSNASFKMDFRVSNLVTADFAITPTRRCTDSVIAFTNQSYNANRFLWYVNGVLADTTTNLTRVFTKTGTYTVKLIAVDSMRCNVADSVTKTVSVGTTARANFITLRDTCSANIRFINLSITSTGDTLPVLWDFGDGTTDTTYNPVKEFNISDAYPVSMYLLNSGGCADTAFQYVNYDRNGHILNAALSPIDSVDCEPGRVMIFSFGRGGQQFEWYANDSLVSNNRNLDIILPKGVYRIKHYVTDSSRCKIRDSAFSYIQLMPDVSPTFSVIRDSCSLTLNMKNETALQAGDSVQFIWYFGDGDSSVSENAKHTYSAPGTYTIQLVVNRGLRCELTSTQDFSLDNNNLVLKAQFNTLPNPACEGNAIQFQNTSINGIRQFWYLNDTLADSTFDYSSVFTQAGTYSMKLIVTDTSTCFPADSITKTFTVFPADTAGFIIWRDTCSAAIKLLNTSDTSGNANASFLWRMGDGTEYTTFNPDTHVYSTNGTYLITLIVNPGSPCADSVTTLIGYDTAEHILKARFEMNDTLFCLPASLQATNTSFNSNSNVWLLNGTIIGTGQTVDTVISEPGNYVLRLIAANDKTCAGTDTFTRTFDAYRSADADFELERDSCSMNTTFRNLSVVPQGQPTTYSWNLGDGTTTDEKEPKHTYKANGTYTVTLITNAGSPCADTASKTYLIDGDTTREVFVPNVFTPNNDSYNDCYRISGIYQKCDEFEVWIRNRWGNLFYTSKNADACWDGNNEQGEPAPSGVYFYIIRIRKKNGKSYDLNGSLHLIRE